MVNLFLFFYSIKVLLNVLVRYAFFSFFLFLRNKHTQGRGKWILTQKHTTTPLKSHGNF